MLPILLATAIFAYFIYAAHILDLHRPALEALCKPIGEWFGEAGNPVRAGVWAGAFVVSLIAWLSPETSFLGEMRGEITGMAITVIVIDELVGYRSAQQEKKRIIRQMASHSNDFALDAVRQIRENGWHTDGSLRKGHFEHANLKEAMLYDAQLSQVNLMFADLENAIMYGINLQDANLLQINFTKADLSTANLQSSNLQEANLADAILWEANLQKANLIGADLIGAQLLGANLEGARLRMANLRHADLSGARLKGANFKGAVYNEYTIFPDGFNEKKSGAILKLARDEYP